MWRWIGGKYGDLIPLLAFLAVLGGTYVYDREKADEINNVRRDRENAAERRASFIGDRLGNAVNVRLGAMSTGELTFSEVQDSVSRRTLSAALDTITNRYPGLMSISPIYLNGTIVRGTDALLGTPGMDPATDTVVGNALRRARSTGEQAATPVVSVRKGRRVVVFKPVARNKHVIGFLAAELDPGTIYRTVTTDQEVADSLAEGGVAPHSLFGPNNSVINSQTLPPGWPVVTRDLPVADTKWQVVLAYPPVELTQFKRERAMRWVFGVLVALFISAIWWLLRRTITSQREEIALRQAAEEAARSSAAEARERAREARELAAQLEAAQRASQRLSTSLDPDDVVELFLGSVAEIL
ncbi:MAG TPA: hypothetical protein VM100_13825, partial [Longimicrobiales bacterium]|nr:hypothetical protein [Longimicrobiales bacterium]